MPPSRPPENADGTGEPVVLRGPENACNRAAWSPDGKRIAVASEDQAIWVWADLEPLAGPEDPRLWAATTYCLPAPRRLEILGISPAAARADQDACLQRIAASPRR